jgi:hypothetical protein
MKSFYEPEVPSVSMVEAAPAVRSAQEISSPSTYARARIAIYDGPAAAPQVVEVCAEDPSSYIEALSVRVHQIVGERGGSIPYTVIRELAENLIHADFEEPVVSILDSGNTVRFADQGPGIPDKEKAVLPGFTTARGEMKRYIRGVGSGLPIVGDFLRISGGTLLIEDNLGCGSVVTISSRRPARESDFPQNTVPARGSADNERLSLDTEAAPSPRLSTRQKQVLALVLESGSAGPSIVSKELGVGLSTAYRDLASLEELGLIESTGGKRALTEKGFSYLDDVSSGH